MVIKLMSIAGARPNFMKLASIAEAIDAYNKRAGELKIQHVIVHTGQHYDAKMSSSFFDDLGIPKPNINLEVGSGSHAAQTAEIIKRFEPVLLQEQPDVLLVVGDVNSTIACTLVAAKVDYPAEHCLRRPLVVHVEAGLRSFDRNMPEEVNRVLTDALSDLLFVTEQSGLDNLRNEGHHDEKICLVGNVMIDTLQRHISKAQHSTVRRELAGEGAYGLVTLHRPSNVDSCAALEPLVRCLVDISARLRLIFPVHPRTQNKLQQFGLWDLLARAENITLTSPLGYLDFLNLVAGATVVVTDSGGIQEETTYLNIPCLTLRENTERPVTVTEGSNYLIGTEARKILATMDRILAGQGKVAKVPELWDGHAGERIVDRIVETVRGSLGS